MTDQEKKILRWTALLVALLVLSWLLFAPGRGLFSYYSLQKTINGLAWENKKLEEQNSEIRVEIQKLQSNKEYIEKIARQKFGLLKNNEILYEDRKEKREKK